MAVEKRKPNEDNRLSLRVKDRKKIDVKLFLVAAEVHKVMAMPSGNDAARPELTLERKGEEQDETRKSPTKKLNTTTLALKVNGERGLAVVKAAVEENLPPTTKHAKNGGRPPCMSAMP